MIFKPVPLFYLCLLLLLASCYSSDTKPEQHPIAVELSTPTKAPAENKADTVADTLPGIALAQKELYAKAPDTAFVVMQQYADSFAYDMKYATKDNFLKQTVYSCAHCLLRKEVADALRAANAHLTSRGLRIKFYDCYRPLDIQKKMWKLYPNARYVANPYTSGSMHNRGGAVDITLVNLEGQELAMGTSFDHFGNEAHHSYTNLPDTVLANRRLLKETMEAHGFNAITSEWWHYSFKGAGAYAVSNFSVACD